MRIRLTDLAVKKLPLSDNGQVTYWDKMTPNFGIRCSTRSKSYIVLLGEKRRRKTLGRYPDLSLAEARKRAKKLLSTIALEDEHAAPPTPTIAFSEARTRFLEDCESRNKPRTVADYRRLLNKHFNFQSDVQEIDRQQVMEVVAGLTATPSEQFHAYVAIRTMMNWCVRQGLIEHSVVPQIKQSSSARTRVLSEDELKEVFRQARKTDYPFGPIVQLLLMTGMRRSEVGSLRRSWISDGFINIPSGVAKNKREHKFPVTRVSRDIISRLPDTGDLLFPAAKNVEKPFSGWAYHKARFDKELEAVEPYVLHDLRRTFATLHARIGTPIHVTEKLLNHVSGTISGVAAIYNQHTYLAETRGAMERFDDHVVRLIAS